MKILKKSDGTIVATSATFKKMSIANTYDRYGQSIDSDEVGDYEVTAYNYFDGSNFKTIILESDIDFIEWEELSEEESAPYLKAIKEKVFNSESYGVKYYKSGELTLAYSFFANAWEDCTFFNAGELEALRGSTF